MSAPARRSSANPASTCCRRTISTTPRRRSSRPCREARPMAEDHLAAPKPLDEHRRLAAFAGEGSGEETVYPSRWDGGGSATSHVAARIRLTAFYLSQDPRQPRNGSESFSSHALFTYDREDR